MKKIRGAWTLRKFRHKEYSGVFKTLEASKMELFSKIVNGRKPLTIFAKSSILKVSSVNLLNLDKVNVVLYVFKVNRKGTRKIARNSKMENL